MKISNWHAKYYCGCLHTLRKTTLITLKWDLVLGLWKSELKDTLAFWSLQKNAWLAELQFNSVRVVSSSWKTGHGGVQKATLWCSGSRVRTEWSYFKDILSLSITCFLQPRLTFQSPSPLKTSPPSGDKASPMMHPQILTQKCSGTDLPGSWHTYQWRQRNIVMGCLQAKEPGSMTRLSSKLWGPGMLLVIFLWVLRAWPYLGIWLFVWLPQMPYSCTRKLSWHPWLFQKLQSWFWSPKDFKNLRHLQLGTRGMPLSPRDTAHAWISLFLYKEQQAGSHGVSRLCNPLGCSRSLDEASLRCLHFGCPWFQSQAKQAELVTLAAGAPGG